MPGEIFIRDVAFTLPNATGAFTITDTGGPGLTPKAAIIFLSGGTVLGTETNTARFGMGMTDGTTTLALSWMAEHNVVDTAADTGRRRANDKILNLTGTASEALAVGATFTSFGVNAMTINMEHASTLLGWVRFFYGANLSAKVAGISGNVLLDGAVNSPSLGFQADGVIAMSGRTQWNTDAGLANAIVSYGFAGRLPSISQTCMGLVAEDRQSPTSVGTLPRNNRILSIIQSTAGVVTEVASIEVTAFNADDIEFTTRDGAEAMGIGFLAFSLGGEKCFADIPVLNSDTMGISQYTDAGFQARSLMVVGQAAPTVGTISSTHGAMSYACFSPQTGQNAMKANDADNLGVSVATSAALTGQFVHVESHWAAGLSKITATGFEYVVSVTAPADLPTVVFSIGEQPGGLGWLDARSGNRWRRGLARR